MFTVKKVDVFHNEITFTINCKSDLISFGTHNDVFCIEMEKGYGEQLIELVTQKIKESIISSLRNYSSEDLYRVLELLEEEKKDDYDNLVDYYDGDDHRDEEDDYEEDPEVKKPKTLGDLECLKRFKN